MAFGMFYMAINIGQPFRIQFPGHCDEYGYKIAFVCPAYVLGHFLCNLCCRQTVLRSRKIERRRRRRKRAENAHAGEGQWSLSGGHVLLGIDQATLTWVYFAR